MPLERKSILECLTLVRRAIESGTFWPPRGSSSAAAHPRTIKADDLSKAYLRR